MNVAPSKYPLYIFFNSLPPPNRYKVVPVLFEPSLPNKYRLLIVTNEYFFLSIYWALSLSPFNSIKLSVIITSVALAINNIVAGCSSVP